MRRSDGRRPATTLRKDFVQRHRSVGAKKRFGRKVKYATSCGTMCKEHTPDNLLRLNEKALWALLAFSKTLGTPKQIPLLDIFFCFQAYVKDSGGVLKLAGEFWCSMPTVAGEAGLNKPKQNLIQYDHHEDEHGHFLRPRRGNFVPPLHSRRPGYEARLRSPFHDVLAHRVGPMEHYSEEEWVSYVIFSTPGICRLLIRRVPGHFELLEDFDTFIVTDMNSNEVLDVNDEPPDDDSDIDVEYLCDRGDSSDDGDQAGDGDGDSGDLPDDPDWLVEEPGL